MAADLDDDDYSLIGRIMEYLGSRPNSADELQRLTQIERFRTFFEQFNDGVAHLHKQSAEHRSHDEISKVVTAMAHLFVDALVDVIHTPNWRQQLLDFLSSDQVRRESRTGASEAAPEGAAPAAIKVVEIRTSTENQQPSPGAAQDESIIPDFLGDWDSLGQTDSSSDALSTPSSQEEKAVVVVEPAPERAVGELKTADPQSSRLQESCRVDMRAILQKAHKTLDGIQRAKKSSTQRIHWQKLRSHFFDLRDTAMIYGIEELETLATKARQLLELSLNAMPAQPEKAAAPEAQSLHQIIGIGTSSPFPNPAENTVWVQLFNEVLTVFDKAVSQDFEFLPMTEIDHIARRLVAIHHQPDRLEELTNAQTIASSPAAEVEDDFKLPGEDDAELLGLIAEVTGKRPPAGRQKAQEPKPDSSREQLKPQDEAQIERIKPAMEKPNQLASNEILYVQNTRFTAKQPQVTKYQKEAQLCFRVIDEALDILEHDPNHRLSLENVELASGSLKKMARQMDLEPLARFPEHVEELVGRVTSMGVPFSLGVLNTVREGYGHLQHVAESPEAGLAAVENIDHVVLQFIKSLDEYTSQDYPTEGYLIVDHPEESLRYQREVIATPAGNF